ncbi:MAG: tRNA (N6-isopentenyl adenosine(37)-C2)-methylthiotransferase MiaB [Acidobacteriota bacterium]
MNLASYYVETWGCQMNVLDSQQLAGVLESRGLQPAGEPGTADVVLLNTCSVREKAVQKVLSRLGELHKLRLQGGNPKVVGLCGCVAEQEGARLLARSRVLSFVLGPGKFKQLPGLLDEVEAGGRPVAQGFVGSNRDYDASLIVRRGGARQLVTAIHGCNQHCTFCVVPYTRGREVSRPLADIVAEVRQLVDGGAREVTLLGQTINAYRCPASGADLADLLTAVGEVEGLWRVQFITSHPAFFTPRLIAALGQVPRLGSYLHLPFQAGSDAVLRRMHRRYTSQEYRELVAAIRAAAPHLTLSTDVIVGFPGESEEDFQDTLRLVEEVRFGQLFGFIYSPRPRTPASRYPGAVPRPVAGERLERLFQLQEEIQLSLNQGLIGRTVEVLLDGPARRGALWQGRGADNRVVNLPPWEGIAAGQLVRVAILAASAHALFGERAAEG